MKRQAREGEYSTAEHKKEKRERIRKIIAALKAQKKKKKWAYEKDGKIHRNLPALFIIPM